MSQILAIKSKNPIIHSSANMAKCDVCGKGLDNGFSVTAKTFLKETRFFCEVHLNY
jgi:hypothetical protein